MTKADAERSPYEGGGAGEKFRNRPSRPEIYEEPQNVSHEAGHNVSFLNTHQGGNSACNSVTFGKSELEQMLKQMTFTRSEAQRFISLLHSRTIEESPTPFLRLEASTTSGSMKRHKHGDERDNFHASAVSSRVLEEEIASPAEPTNAYKASTIDTQQDSKWFNNNAICLTKTPMASPQHPTTMDNLPNELLLNILIRLLAKKLAQIRSVSKCWNALLSHPSFVKSHLNRCIHKNNQILLVFTDEEESCSNPKAFTTKPSPPTCLELTNFIKPPVNPQSEDTSCIKVIGSVNGLICSCYGDSVIHIWNPSLCAMLTLPPYSTPCHGYNSIRIHFRFAFDPKTDDYKVVKLTGLTGPYINVITWWLQVEIYSMRKGSWELITARFPSHLTTINHGDYVCVDGHHGHLHWLGWNTEVVSSKTIVAFDLGSETFRELPLPDSSTLDHNRSNDLGVLAGKLCVISQVESDGRCEVWVMEEYGVAESWVKRHVFSQFSDCACTFGFTSHNEFLIEDNGCLVLYDPSANNQKFMEDHCPDYHGVHNIVEYVDSLVWVAPAEYQIVDDGGQN